jgi:hypothetical protein
MSFGICRDSLDGSKSLEQLDVCKLNIKCSHSRTRDSAIYFGWGSGTKIYSPTDGVIKISINGNDVVTIDKHGISSNKIFDKSIAADIIAGDGIRVETTNQQSKISNAGIVKIPEPFHTSAAKAIIGGMKNNTNTFSSHGVVAIGGENNTATIFGQGSVLVGSSKNTCTLSGSGAVIVGSAETQDGSDVAGVGDVMIGSAYCQNKTSNKSSGSVIIGGVSCENIISTSGAVIIGGISGSQFVSGLGSVIISSEDLDNTVTGESSMLLCSRGFQTILADNSICIGGKHTTLAGYGAVCIGGSSDRLTFRPGLGSSATLIKANPVYAIGYYDNVESLIRAERLVGGFVRLIGECSMFQLDSTIHIYESVFNSLGDGFPLSSWPYFTSKIINDTGHDILIATDAKIYNYSSPIPIVKNNMIELKMWFTSPTNMCVG